MNQQALAKQPESSVPTTPFSAPLLSKLRQGMGRINGLPTLMQGFEITPAEHQHLEKETLIFRQKITAGTYDRLEIGAELARLMAAFPAQAQSDAPASLRVEAYLDAIGNAPAWAVKEARLRFVRGEVRDVNLNFAPTPPVFAGIVRDVLTPFRKDLADLEALVRIGVTSEPSPEERQRVSEGFDRLKAEMPAGKKREAQSKAAKAAAADESLRAVLRDRGKSEAEVDEIMSGLKIAEPKPGSFQRPQTA